MRVDFELRLHQLCEQASKEHDSNRLLDLVRQINELLDQKRKDAQTKSAA